MIDLYRNKIVILIPYYGKFPWYFSYFLHSCRFNLTIDFIIFTDTVFSGVLPPNVRIISKTLSDIKELASRALQIPASLEFPYKLCDFKPAYGLIFQEYTVGYDFWGQSDIDVIYGDLRGFMDDEMLDKYDFISVRHDYTTGCFALYRNTGLMNNIFKRSKDYERVFSTISYLGFDECNFNQEKLTDDTSIFDLETDIESFTHIIRSAQNTKEINAHFDFLLLEGTPGRIRFEEGKMIYKNRYEAVLYHLYWLKRAYEPNTTPEHIPDRYSISKTRMYLSG